ncbi:MAG: resolvase, terminal domain protein [Caballeronia mineralivorans]|nr:recombinase family protein [Caballeronia mineralivorans]MDB5784794.1 resolvase, terminal domain protein [Caballeronia mineralivorans]
MAVIGYARVSTFEQNLELQQDAMRAAGALSIYEDKAIVVAASRFRVTILERCRRCACSARTSL